MLIVVGVVVRKSMVSGTVDKMVVGVCLTIGVVVRSGTRVLCGCPGTEVLVVCGGTEVVLVVCGAPGVVGDNPAVFIEVACQSIPTTDRFRGVRFN